MVRGRRLTRRGVAPSHRVVLAACALLAAAFVAVAVPAGADAAPGDVVWARIVPGVITGGGDRVLDVAPGPAGSVYAVGVYDEPAFTGWTWVARYSSDGTKLWVKKYGKAQHLDANCVAMAVDGAGNLVVVGSRRPLAGGNLDMLVLKYSPYGGLLWARRYDGPGHGPDYATSVVTDAAGNVHAAGVATQAGGLSSMFAVVKWNAAGDRRWAATYSGTSPVPEDGAAAIAIDSHGNTYATGRAGDSPTTSTCTTIKVGPSGVVRWAKTLSPGAVDNRGLRVAVRGSSVYVAGKYSGDGPVWDVFLARYSTGGTWAWSSYSGLMQHLFYPLALAVDAGGRAWLASAYVDSLGGSHAALVKFRPNGNIAWAATDSTLAAESAFFDVVVDGEGRSWAAGRRTPVSTLKDDVFVVCYSSGGTRAWAKKWHRAPALNADAVCACLVGPGGLVVGGSTDRAVTPIDALLLRLRR